MKKMTVAVLFLAIAVLLTGCMYPANERVENQMPHLDQLLTVQTAIERYQEASGGLLPIKTRDMDEDQYIKYPIDFSKLMPDFLSEMPSNAYESGGIFQYVIMDVEENPTVKLVDLRIAEAIRSINVRKAANGGRAPVEEVIADNVFKLNYSAMGFNGEQFVTSPYSGRNLPMVINGRGDVFVDYSMDLFTELQDYDGELEEGEDIRFLLFEESPIVPAYSLPYTVNEQNEPIFNNSENR
ncbi:MAG TPA: hypothetical protein VK947_00395 [Planococcus sp. (in: firmicutes)]|nr:hypothetical protein [Planococcus sp. (in: firmicutes)]